MPYTVYMKYLGRALSMQETGYSILVSKGGGGGGEGGGRYRGAGAVY